MSMKLQVNELQIRMGVPSCTSAVVNEDGWNDLGFATADALRAVEYLLEIRKQRKYRTRIKIIAQL
jgi:hypothetical protein